MAALLILPPAGAQTPPPATASTPGPTVTPTKTLAELGGVQEPITWVNEALQYGLIGLFGLALLAAAVWTFRRYSAGAGKVIEETGESHARKLQQTLGRPAQAQQQQQQQSAGLTAYLHWLQEECGALPQKPLDEDDEELQIEQVYVPLRVVERDQMERFVAYRLRDFGDAEEQAVREAAFEGLAQSQGVFRLLSDRDSLPALDERSERSRRRLSADAPISEIAPTLTERLLLVGEAGSGKTTTLHFGALMLARDHLKANSINARTALDLHAHRRYIPVYIKLTLLTRYLLEKYRADRSRLTNRPADLVYEWLDTDLPRQCEAIPAGLIVDQLKQGACLVLFDGLDETGDAAERDFAKGLIGNLLQACPGNRYIVASRPFDGVALGLSGFIERHLSPLDEQEMRQLLDQWFRAVGASTRRQRRSIAQEFDELWECLQTNPRLFDMATNPLLLTSRAILVHGGEALPAERARVYHRLVNLTIVRWRDAELRRGLPPEDPERTRRIFEDESDDDVRLRLQVLAAYMLEQQQREIPLREIQEQLARIYETNRGWKEDQCRNYIHRLMQSLSLHSGLIQERDERYSFVHFTLQEYLTVRHYDEIGNITGLLQRWGEPRWRETILLAVGHWATSGYRQRAEQALTELIANGEAEALLLAAEALDEANARRVVALGAVLTACVAKLRTLAFDPARCPDPVIRNRAATMLDRLDADTERPGLDLTQPDYWAQPIAPGTFSMGDGNGQYNYEKPQFDYTIRQPYALARFPVTNRQYLLFVEALAGRGTPEAVAAARQLLPLMAQHQQTPEQFHPRFWPGARYRAGAGNHPVVGVTWYAATAYAWWVDAWLRAQGLLPDGEAIRLPTEPEWERAAAYPPALAPLVPPASRGMICRGAPTRALGGGSIPGAIGPI
jgi:hypothetical protein